MNSIIKKIFNSNEVIKKVLDSVNDAICIVDENYEVVVWNKSAEKLHDLDRNQIMGHSLTEFFPNALLPKVINERKEYINHYNSPREGCFNIVTAQPIYENDRIIGAISADRDVSDFIDVSMKLEETKADLNLLKTEINNIIDNSYYFEEILGDDIDFVEAKEIAKSISKTDISVLLTGESGTGKEMFARAIHMKSGRNGYFVPINCSAIPADLLESELFGYEKGAFTGANTKGRVGKFELANDGTLFLDEIGDMPLAMQAKILRVLEDGIVTKVGSDKSNKVNVRIIAATNRNLKNMMNRKEFRSDLYYRLNALHIDLPPLRKRKKDVRILINKFLDDYSEKYNLRKLEMDPDTLRILINYEWYGNVRELKNVIERMIILAKNSNIELIGNDLLPNDIVDRENFNNLDNDMDLVMTLEATERKMILKALEMNGNSKSKAAKSLGIPRTTLYSKMDKYNLSV